MEKRIGFIGIIVEDSTHTGEMNSLLSQYAHLLVGRMGIPRHGTINVITVVVEGSNDEIGALTGKLGAIPGIMVRSALSNYRINDEDE